MCVRKTAITVASAGALALALPAIKQLKGYAPTVVPGKFARGTCIVVAWCELREGFRHFRTDRIGKVQGLDKRYPPASAGFYADLPGHPILDSSPTFAMLPLSEGVMLGLWSRKTVEPAANAQAGASEVAFTVENAVE